MSAKKPSVTVVVMGDLGHSPRMSYHALSLAQEGYHVNLIGHAGSKPQKEIRKNPLISITHVPQPPGFVSSLSFKPLRLVLRVIWQTMALLLSLVWAQARHRRSSCFLLQNPPVVPALPVCLVVAFIIRARLVIDWHNYGYSILALSLGNQHPLVWLYYWVEKWGGRMASAGLCVSEAMRKDLEEGWGIRGVTVHYDRPPLRFRTTTQENKHNLFLKLSEQLPCLAGSSPDKSVFTERFADGRISCSEDRPALMVSSTSWTEDEDFGVLLRALDLYEREVLKHPQLYPRLIVIITGKGPLKDHYMNQARSLSWQCVEVDTAWLEPGDYPGLLAAADLGVCLHTSSSGLDLPMKVVDMFGCGLPVLAKAYPTIGELVVENENGLLFSNEFELFTKIKDWFDGFPVSDEQQERTVSFRRNLELFNTRRWHDFWVENVQGVLDPLPEEEGIEMKELSDDVKEIRLSDVGKNGGKED